MSFWSAGVVGAVMLLMGCTSQKGPLGSEENPVKFFFVPSVDAKVIADKSKLIEVELEKRTGLQFQISMPASFIAVVEAFGTKRADAAAINTFGYVLASEKYGAEAALTVMRFGKSTYEGQFVVRSDSPIKKLEDINGKKMAYVDPASATGYLLPAKMLKDKGVKPAETVFAQKHDNVISMVYQKQVDVGASFHSPIENGEIQDARRLVLKQYPDVGEKIKILALTESIPNDPIVFGKHVPVEIRQKVVTAIMDMMQTPQGAEAFKAIYGVTAFQPCQDSDYAGVKKVLADLGIQAKELVK